MPGIQFTFEVNDTVSSAIEGIKGKIDSTFENQETLAKFNAGLGQSKEITAQMGDLAKKVFREGYGEDLGAVTDAIGAVGSQMVDLGATSPAEVEKLTKGALDLADVMGEDVTGVTRAAGQMMKNGLAPDAQTAFDIIATGAQNGMNRSGDMLDVLSEYGPSFNALGINGVMAMDLINSSLDDGAFNADKAADAINEFGVRAIDGSKGTIEAYGALGLSADEMAQKIAAGGPAAQQATSQIITRLGEMTDPVAQEAAGVAFFGSMWEDMGKSAILALDPAYSSTDELTAATADMGKTLHDTAKNKVDTMKRSFDGWVDSLVESDGPLGGVMTWAQSFGPEVLAVGSQVGIAAMAISNMGIASKITAGFQWLLNAAMSANPIMLIVAVIAALVAGFIYLWNTSEGFRDFWIGLWEKAQAVLSAAVDWIVARWTNLTDWFSSTMASISWWFTSTWNDIKSFFSGVVDWLKQRVTDVTSWFSQQWEFFKAGLQVIWTSIRDFIGDRLADVKGFATSVRDWFVGRFQDVANFVSGIFVGIARTVGSVATTIWTIVTTVFDWVRTRINDLVGFIQSIPQRVSSSIQGIKDAITTGSGFSLSVRPGMSILTNSFPKLADGGIVMPRAGGTNVTVGEAGEAEAVIPLSKLGMSGGGITINVHGSVIQERDLARTVQEAVARARRSGAIPAGGF